MSRGGDPRCPVDVVPDVTLVREQRRPRVQPDPNADRARRERLRHRGCGRKRTRCGREGEEERVALGVHLDPAVGRQTSRTSARCSARASAYLSAPSSCSSLVEPSTSVKRKVTVPDGRSVCTAR